MMVDRCYPCHSLPVVPGAWHVTWTLNSIRPYCLMALCMRMGRPHHVIPLVSSCSKNKPHDRAHVCRHQTMQATSARLHTPPSSARNSFMRASNASVAVVATFSLVSPRRARMLWQSSQAQVQVQVQAQVQVRVQAQVQALAQVQVQAQMQVQVQVQQPGRCGHMTVGRSQQQRQETLGCVEGPSLLRCHASLFHPPLQLTTPLLSVLHENCFRCLMHADRPGREAAVYSPTF